MSICDARDVPRTGVDVAFRATGPDPRPAGLDLQEPMPTAIRRAVLRLDAWFDTMRRPGGYGGPVVHWWRDCLDYIGPGLDWRYEGIIIGYLNLWEVTGEDHWLQKASRAGDDLVAGQLPSGNFRNSAFELNPNTGGTPHEAAADLGLLRLAVGMRLAGKPGWERFAQTAQRNLSDFFVGKLWDEAAKSFRDAPEVPSFVPNKAATLTEALFTLSSLSGDSIWAEKYALPTLDKVLAHQIIGGELHGAIYQNSFGARKVEKFFPYYVARCIPGLLNGYQWSGQERYAEAARKAAAFVMRSGYPDGSFPQVIYPGEKINRYPQWVAAIGDMLRALCQASLVGIDFDPLPALRWLLSSQQPDGSFRTAVGFGRATPGKISQDARDTTPVVGWSDKAFRFLSSLYA